ncbi:LacI family DNA-binding transcriptional regulator [Clostridium sp.]|uniref:LacI family DNA-binding transcriptional regulator n=1 Tax=Clostridium sp. TaxID=1506 RepID=UPI003F378904
MKVTIKDVAKEANVATSTVSRVLSGSQRISEETKARVHEAIKKLNYTPNVIARGLANKRTRILAVVLPEEAEDIFSNPFFVQAMKGISVCAQKENYYIMYAFKEKDNEEEAWIKKFTDSKLVDGICLLNVKDNDDYINNLTKMKFPFVVIGRPENIGDTLWVDNDNFQAMYNLVQRFIDMGHREIGFIGGKGHLNVSKDRFNGYKQALLSRGLDFNDKLILEMKDFTESEGYIAAREILKENKLTAIATTDDLLAFGVQRFLNEMNLGDIALAGFNNTPLAQYQTPSLTSVDINSEQLGYYATKLLINKLEDREQEKKYYIIDTELIERDSFLNR